MPRTDHDTLSTSCRINQKWLVCFSSLKQKFQGKDESSSETQALQEFSSVRKLLKLVSSDTGIKTFAASPLLAIPSLVVKPLVV